MYFDIDAHKGCFSTKPDEAYFWHGRSNGCGGQHNAMEIARENNGKTLEMCMLEHREQLQYAGVVFVDKDKDKVSIDYNGNLSEANQFWDDCSKAFAEQASGNIHVIDGFDPRQNGQLECDYPSVYNRIEYPALAQNPNVNSITHIDPFTQQPTKVESFDRQFSNSASSKALSFAGPSSNELSSLAKSQKTDNCVSAGPAPGTVFNLSSAQNGVSAHSQSDTFNSSELPDNLRKSAKSTSGGIT